MSNCSNLLIKCVFLVLISIMIQSVFAENHNAKGCVYLDKNNNGRRDSNENGIEKIGISNGRQIVLTDNKGYYSIAAKSGDVIFVIKPKGYRTAISSSNLPSFYYLYSPNGSPQQRYEGILPTGKLPKSIDFGLSLQDEPSEFRMMVFGDPQMLHDKDIDYFNRGIIEDVLKNEKKVSFGLTMGDITYDDLTVIPKYIQHIKKLGVPWYHTGGNHDLNFDASSDEFAHETYKSFFGPLIYSFNYANVHFIVINNVIYKGGTYEQKGEYQGGIRKSHFEFIENDLKHVPKEKLVVLVSHIPYVGREGNPTISKNNLDQLFTLLKDHKHTFSIAAHTHTQGQRFVKNPYFKNSDLAYHHQFNVGTTSGNLYSGVLDNSRIPPAMMADGTPKGYAFINFKDNQYTIDYKVAGKSQNNIMHIQVPKVLLKHEKTRASFYVNYYLGGELDSLSYRINGGEWNKLTRVTEYDPLFLQQIYEWDKSPTLLNGKRPTPASLCTHLWKGMLFGVGDLGTQKVEIKIQDMFQRIITETIPFELVDN